MNFNDYNLKENPFRVGPPLNPKEIIWAGFRPLKDKFENRIKTSLKTSPSRIVLNWGRYGSGKTHAANYFTRTDRINQLAQDLGVKTAKSIKVNLPRTSKDPVQAFLRSFLGQVSLKDIQNDLRALIEVLDKERVEEIINAVSSDNVITELFHLIINDNGENFVKLEGYLFGDTTKGTLASLSLPSGLKDDEQIVNLLSTYLSAVTFDKNLYSSFFLWLDEFEDIDTLNKVSQDRFTTFLRQLFDKTSNNLTLFLNFTPKTFFNVEDLSITLGEALATRAKLQIVFEEPKIGEAKEYLYELLNNDLFRVNQVQDFRPFEEAAVVHILEHIGRLSIRKINEVFSLIIELALLHEKGTVDTSFVNEIHPEIISWEA